MLQTKLDKRKLLTWRIKKFAFTKKYSLHMKSELQLLSIIKSMKLM